MNEENTRPVIICTDKRGVFFGYVPYETTDEELLGPDTKVSLTRARMAIYWKKGGVMGLAEAGPQKECRIGRRAPKITVIGVHAVMTPSLEAVRMWELPWE